jgi:hypothetical protein
MHSLLLSKNKEQSSGGYFLKSTGGYFNDGGYHLSS